MAISKSGFVILPEDVQLQKACSIVSALQSHGHTAFLVGGCVRDLILGKVPKDYDVCTSATPEQVQTVYTHNYAVGESFGVIKVNIDGDIFDVTTYRSEKDYSDSRHPDIVKFETNPAEDVVRRDFTINGLLLLPNGFIIDHVEGLVDIENGIIRAIGDPSERFTEDPLRVMRAVRFATQLGFTIETDTYAAVILAAPMLIKISMERRREEFRKILESPEPYVGIKMLEHSGILAYILPELLKLKGVTQPAKYHRYDVDAHVYQMIAHAAKPMSFELAMAILLHDIAKPNCKSVKPDGTIHFYNHEHVGKEMSLVIGKRLKLTNDECFLIGEFVHKHMRPHSVLEMKPATIKRLCRIPRFEEFLELHRLDCICSNGNMETYNFLWKFYQEHKHEIEVTPLLTGYHLLALGFKPGPIYKKVLEAVETKQLNGELTTPGQAIDYVLALVCQYKAANDQFVVGNN